tara:strand:- start:1827 stop:2051 length:225 start_codon:yes stop_codon:yes gene_type:complete
MSNETPEAEWKGMPEFVQEKQEPFSKIIIRFETEADLKEFAELIGQKLTPKTKSIWHPHKPHRKPYVRKWVDES